MTSETATASAAVPPGAASRQGPPGRASADRPPTPWQQRLRRFGYVEPPRGDARERLVVPLPEPGGWWRRVPWLSGRCADLLARWSGWGGPLLVALLAGVLRFWHLGSPRAVIFDETYYAKDAWALLRHGYESSWPDNANQLILAHPQKIPLGLDPSYVVHPPVGKWIIALGEWAFGLNPFGWRFMVALLGSLAVLMVCRIGRRLLRSTALGCLAGLLMAVDGLEFVMSRASLLDLIVMFFVVAAFGALLVDRDAARARLAAALPADGQPDARAGAATRLGARPWRIAAGVLLGLAGASKWNGLVYVAAFGVLTLLWDAGARRTAGAWRPYRAVARRDLGPAFLSLVPVALLTYLASWTGWFVTDRGYFRHWADGRGGTWSWIPAPLRSLWHYQYQVYEFNVHLTQPHTYQSNPWSWLVLGRPVSYFYESPKPGQDGCHAAGGCAREVLAIGTPLLWWTACFALAYLLYRWALRRDWRAGAVLCGVAAGYLPWFLYQERTIFLFYAVVFVPFLCLAVAMMLGALLGPRGAPERRRMWGAVGAGTLVLLIIWNFIYFFPLYTGMTIPLDAWRHRMWLDTWI
ncbi:MULTISPECIES: dolichyl-phosphate-mannose--protein mannosyltransferase [Streptomycetaceae]|uniref:Polyprenol-phosphate-mannose--protein mannosyltransferase n=1 Tax=Streptantibioticus cattleyicolor (strain ATCC 35852 / DSM 46488 / JCM 4925 / NBRC 14057 / NRRL 8057) TaxID=1003195 RepID=F8JWD6_STREN|nr:phospholipid carrier-dependent glycosyltransferase [Streptantibioticus cattleyicolor]AEW94509.1 glycosyl transferase family 39 [Streptantibioticus cattleyicolor NRRL 8057 = DSM 46488]MYS59153.1 phospholipid carrier-dependent glycosyltransferase [Streptomyces sp. SID5468]CCB74866.1 putative enzyme [Streptantibioticus cattleyicolor NRRL 8057 = DSM 46488]